MNTLTIARTRGAVAECLHEVEAALVLPAGKLLAHYGDPGKYSYFRSSAKPIQALALFLSGAADHFGFTDAEIAIACASHFAEDFHLAAVRSILNKIGLSEAHLQCGASRSIKSEYAFAQAEAGVLPSAIQSDCSGKHAAMLATCVLKGYPLDSYLEPAHPLQMQMLRIISEVCAYPAVQIQIGIDGCGVPVFALPIFNMALGFARFASPEYLPEIYQEPAMRIFRAMNAFPQNVSGTGGFCSELMRATGGRLIGKAGAMGVYAIGIKDQPLGLALKVKDGTPGISPVAAMEILLRHQLISDSEYEKLQHFHKPPILNTAGKQVGYITAEF
ncbi:MAG: asparaginase [Candidatus Cloacimonetes bacterium]|nr:asparaginase [Candidatus Cloacimonadota bacterium]